jgi:WD40 repeat protein
MLRRWALSLFLGVVIFGIIAWSLGVWPLGSSNTALGDPDPTRSETEQANLGDLLYTAEAVQLEPTSVAGTQQLAAIVIPACHLAPEHLQVISSQREGQLLVIGAEVTPAEFARLPKDKRAAIFVQEKNQTVQRFYRRLLKGDVVKQSSDLGASTVGLLGSMMGQGSLAAAVALFPGRTQSPMVALVDPVLAYQDLAIKEAKVIAAQKDALAAEKILEELQEQHKANTKLYYAKPPAIPEEQWRVSKVQAEKARYDLENKREAVKVSQSELNQSATMLDLHTIRNKYDGVWFIDRVLHNPGESLQPQKSMEVLLISRLDQLKAEGQVDVQYRKQLEDNNNEVLVEPSQEASPHWILTGHRGEIKALAVSKEDLIVSASDDGRVQVWNLSKNAPWVLGHPTAVQAVACSPGGAKDQEHSWCVSGCSDGTIRKWDLSQWGKTDVKAQPLAERHSEGVSCLAFSPNGEWFASGGEDNAIFLWETKTGKLKYKFDERWGHRGSITALHFTRQAKLISAGKDNTLRIWTLCQQGARLDEAITGREGKVSHLGVSHDGQALLLDRGNTLQVLRVQDRLPLGVLQNTAGITPFETVALFAPGFVEDPQKSKGKDRLGGKRRLILTAGASEGRLQLWVAPTPSQRGYEFVQLVPPATDRSPVTCAAFSAQVKNWLADQGEPSFAVSGTKNGQVFVWPMPSRAEILNYQLPGKLELVGTSVEANTRQLPIIVHLDNPMMRNEDGIPKYRLMTGRTVTVVVQPRTP